VVVVEASANATIRVRRIRPGEGAVLRDVRLRALADAPEAFASTLDDERRRPIEEWDRRAREGANSDTDATFLAMVGSDAVGMAGVYRPEHAGDQRHIYGMWVAPDIRGGGAGRALVDAACGWAWSEGTTRVTLWVVDQNQAANALYGRAGFRPTGRTQPLPSHPHLRESLLELHRPPDLD
jgi:RimJ/RimL family protein N-acetyltransferase